MRIYIYKCIHLHIVMYILYIYVCVFVGDMNIQMCVGLYLCVCIYVCMYDIYTHTLYVCICNGIWCVYVCACKYMYRLHVNRCYDDVVVVERTC